MYKSNNNKRKGWPRYGKVDSHVGLRGQEHDDEGSLSCIHSLTEFRIMNPRLRSKKVFVQESATKVVARKGKLVIRKRSDCGGNALSERVSLTQKNFYPGEKHEDDDDMPLLNWSNMAGPQKVSQTRAWLQTAEKR